MGFCTYQQNADLNVSGLSEIFLFLALKDALSVNMILSLTAVNENKIQRKTIINKIDYKRTRFHILLLSPSIHHIVSTAVV